LEHTVVVTVVLLLIKLLLIAIAGQSVVVVVVVVAAAAPPLPPPSAPAHCSSNNSFIADNSPVWGRGTLPLSPFSPCLFTSSFFALFYFSLSIIGFTYFLLCPSLLFLPE